MQHAVHKGHLLHCVPGTDPPDTLSEGRGAERQFRGWISMRSLHFMRKWLQSYLCLKKIYFGQLYLSKNVPVPQNITDQFLMLKLLNDGKAVSTVNSASQQEAYHVVSMVSLLPHWNHSGAFLLQSIACWVTQPSLAYLGPWMAGWLQLKCPKIKPYCPFPTTFPSTPLETRRIPKDLRTARGKLLYARWTTRSPLFNTTPQCFI